MAAFKDTVFTLCIFFIIAPSLAFAEFFIADDEAFPPYISANEDNKPVGIFFDILTTAFKRMNEPLRYEVFAWNRAQKIAKELEADALITVPTAARQEYFVKSKYPVFVMKYKIFTQSDNPQLQKIKSIESLKDLKGLKIVDYLGDGWAKENLAQYEIDWTPNIYAVCRKLAAGRGDIFIQDEFVTYYSIKMIKKEATYKYGHLNFDNLISFDVPVSPVAFHLLVNKKSPYLYLLDQYDQAFSEMKANGEVEAIENKWLR